MESSCEYESNLRSKEHYLSSSENKALKKIQVCTGFEPMTHAIPVQRSTNWTNKPMLVPNKPVKWWINDCGYMKVIYLNCG